MEVDNSTVVFHINTTTVASPTVVFPQEAAILAAVCACLFSIVGVVGMFFCVYFNFFGKLCCLLKKYIKHSWP